METPATLRLRGFDCNLEGVPESSIPAVNVATVPQRSPLRYPGGKTWLIPHVRAWFSSMQNKPDLLVEPFAGGGIVSLTAIMEDLAPRCVLSEIDDDVADFWESVLFHSEELVERVQCFLPSRDNVLLIAKSDPADIVGRGFKTLVLNRTRRGGIIANGASLTKVGEAGKGLSSRWYPNTISRRIRDIAKHSNRIEFLRCDGLQLLTSLSASLGTAVIFVDPPYTAAGKRAGRRLYNHSDINHIGLFDFLGTSNHDFLMTYDQSAEIFELATRHSFQLRKVFMKNTHHERIWELLITRRGIF